MAAAVTGVSNTVSQATYSVESIFISSIGKTIDDPTFNWNIAVPQSGTPFERCSTGWRIMGWYARLVGLHMKLITIKFWRNESQTSNRELYELHDCITYYVECQTQAWTGWSMQ